MGKSNRQIIRNRQEGFASIAIALVLVIVLSLITVGFTQLARREQQTALNKQLATQAFFAAESGVNDTINALATNPALPSSTTDCINPSLLTTGSETSSISRNTGVSYSCVIFSQELKDLQHNHISANDERSSVFSTDNGLDSMSINWSNSSGTVARANSDIGKFTNKTDWNNGNYPPVIQFSITKLGNGTNLDRQAMIDSTRTYYLYPTAAAGTINYGSTPQGSIVNGNCSGPAGAPLNCEVTINGINDTGGEHYYLIRMNNNYVDGTDIRLYRAKDTSGIDLLFKHSQALIDVTGKSRTVLKRVQVRVSLFSNTTGGIGTAVDLPSQAVEAGDICKRLSTFPASTVYKATNNANASSTDIDNGACDVN